MKKSSSHLRFGFKPHLNLLANLKSHLFRLILHANRSIDLNPIYSPRPLFEHRVGANRRAEDAIYHYSPLKPANNIKRALFKHIHHFVSLLLRKIVH